MYFQEHADKFSLGEFGPTPLREAQRGALHAIAAHFTISDEPALVALPTGVGKTAVANAVPYLFPDARRVLVVEPSVVLRQQMAEEFRTLEVLKRLGLLPEETPPPSVHEVAGHPESWEALEQHQVLVAHPNSLRATSAASGPSFPSDYFNVVIIDEAHHVAAPTWNAIVDYTAEAARHVLLTATPFRRDRRRIPGRVIYDYPLSRAVAANAYEPVELVAVPSVGLTSEHEKDSAIRDRVLERLETPEHNNSGVLVRARTKERAQQLVAMYSEVGVELELVHSNLTTKTVERRLAAVQAGDSRGAAFVGILGEGFDCPRLKVGAYHDKHKSLPATLQFVGRLSRVSDTDVGPAEVVTTLEDLRSTTWELYRHDSVWREIIPRLVEQAGEEVRTRAQVFERLPEIEVADLTLHDIAVRRQTVVYEIEEISDDWEPDFSAAGLQDLGLAVGDLFAGGSVLWSAGLPVPFLAMITSHTERPRWARTNELDSTRYEFHAVAPLRNADTGKLLAFVTSNTRTNERALVSAIAPDHTIRKADPELVVSYLSEATFTRFFGVGLRSANASGANLSYTMHAGRQVDQGIAASDTQGLTLGHLSGAAQLPDNRQASVGASPSNARIWDNSYCYLNEYIEWLEALAAALQRSSRGTLERLPNLSAPSSFDSWPDARPLHVEPDYTFYRDVISVAGRSPGYVVEFSVARSTESSDCMHLTASYGDDVIWEGGFSQRWAPVNQSSDVQIALLGSDYRFLGDYLREVPPTLYFANGMTTRGTTALTSQISMAPQLPDHLFEVWNWAEVDITSETSPSEDGQSIHAAVEERLLEQFAGEAWVLHDDGSNELADHVVIEPSDDRAVRVYLVHSKPSSESTPGVRAEDIDVVLQQAMRSRRFLDAGLGFWGDLIRRLNQRASTRVINNGAMTEETLRVRCEQWRFESPLMQAAYWIVQPGLSKQRLNERVTEAAVGSAQASATQSLHAAWTWLCSTGGRQLRFICSA